MDVFEREARAGFPRMVGARVDATVPISEDVLNDMLRHIFTSMKISIEIEDSNHIVVHFPVGGSVPLILPPEICLMPSPSLRLQMAKAWQAWLLRGVLAGTPHTRVRGSFVDLDLIAMTPPAYRHLWKHLASGRIHTDKGRAIVDVALATT